MRMASNSYALSIVYGLKLEHPFEETLWQRERRTRVTWSWSTLAGASSFAQLRSTNSIDHILSHISLALISCTKLTTNSYPSWLKTARVIYRLLLVPSNAIFIWCLKLVTNEWIGVFFLFAINITPVSTKSSYYNFRRCNLIFFQHSSLHLESDENDFFDLDSNCLW